MAKKKTTSGELPEYLQRAHASAQKSHAAFETAEDFETACNAYFAECDMNGELYGEAGLCLGLTKYNKKGRVITLNALREWYDGTSCEWLKDSVQFAYLRIQSQIESDPRYQEKGGMATRGIFLQKQKRFGGYQDKQETTHEATVNIVFGKGVDASDFK